MSLVFDALPGIEVPVGGITQSLARLWDGEAGTGWGRRRNSGRRK